MTYDIRPIPADAMRHWLDTVNAAFGEQGDEEQWRLNQMTLEPGRLLGAFDGDALVGGGGIYSLGLTVPGGSVVATAGVTAVGVLPTHRRQGILTQLMARQLQDVRQRGEPLAALWASEGIIYQRFGYGLGTLTGNINIERERTAFRNPLEREGTMRLVDRDEARRLMPEPFDAVRSATPGFYERRDAWWDVFLADPKSERHGASGKFYVVHEREGRAVGYVVYRIKAEWGDIGSASSLLVLELVGVDARAVAQLWRYVFGVDLIARIIARRGPANHPLLLLLADPRRAALRLGDGLWLRIVDVGAALDSRGYAADGEIVLDVSDGFMPDWAGRWRLTATAGQGHAEPTGAAPDLRLDTTDLAAVYLGAFTFADLARAGRTHEQKPGAWARADRLFRTGIQPWCGQMF